MVEKHPKDDRGSVLLTIESGGLSTVSLEIAVAIAASLQSRIHGLFIENEDLLRVASLPFTREISLTTAEERPTDFDVMQRSLQSMASSFKKSIKLAAQLSKVPWSFDYVSGSSQKAHAFSQPGFSFTIVGQSIRRSYTPIRRPVRRVLLIEDHSPNLIHALKIVLQQFAAKRVELTIIAARPEAGGPENQDLYQYLDQIKTHVSMIELDRENLANLLDTSAACYDCAIVSLREDAGVRGELLDKLRCPLILVS